MTLVRLSNYIDHTLLKPDARKDAIRRLCEEALTYQFAAVCVLPVYVEFAAHLLGGSPVKVCSVVGFPLGANTVQTKCFETEQLVRLGAQEIDMVIHVGALKDMEYEAIRSEIAEVVSYAAPAIVKVIIETSLLTDDEIVIASKLAAEGGAHYVKTSTGYAKSGATVADIELIRKSIPSHIKIKASGGIRDYATAIALINAGADRIGTSAGVELASIEL